MSLFSYAFVCAIAFSIAFTIFRYLGPKLASAKKRPPPGPPKLPLLGNLLNIPKNDERPWETYEVLGRMHNSDIIHFQVFGNSIVVLNGLEAATELLDKRSLIYSDRPHFTMLNDLMGWDFNFAFMSYGDEWRARRSLFQQAIHPITGTQQLQPRKLVAAHQLLRHLLGEPNRFMAHIRNMAGFSILSIAYGLDTVADSKSNKYILLAEEALDALTQSVLPGSFLVDAIPVLKYVPEWFPGAGFKRKAREWRQLAERFRDLPFEDGMRNLAQGSDKPSFLSSCFGQIDGHGGSSGDDADGENPFQKQKQDLETVFKSAAATMHAGAIETTYAALCTFVLAMLSNPNAQKRAQDEMDKVLQLGTGDGELPRFSDQPSLPFVTAIVKEVLRWKPVAPFGVPHSVARDDVYKGYTIPKKSQVIANIWAMLHDEEKYPDPNSFEPERFINPDGSLNLEVQDPEGIAFGFGRRVCPGSNMALSTLWITIASILAVFDITKAEGDEPSFQYTFCLAYIPKPFKCSIRPRGPWAVDLIHATETS